MAQVKPFPTSAPGARVPPHDLEAEESVLGSMMLSRNAVGEVLEIVHADDFYREAHEKVCAAILDLFSRGEPIDAITVGDELNRRSQLEDIGGHPYLYTLVSSVPTAANAAYYARIVAEHATLRRLIDAATQIAQEAYEVPGDIESTINRAEELVYAVSARRIGQDFRPIRELLAESIEQLETLASRSSDVTGVATGFTDLDMLTSGFQPGNLILVAARPAMGKSSLVMNIAHNVALGERLPVVCFSLEMSWMEIVQRLICAEARVDTKKLRTGHLSEADWTRVSNAVGRLAEAPLFIDDTPSISMGEIRAKCRRIKQKHGLGLVVVDYIQLMNSSRRIENRVQEVAEISRSMKILAKELDLPVVAVSQLSRNPEQAGRGGDRRPRLADLRECVTGDTLVCLADGRRVPIAGLVGTTPEVLAADADGLIVRAVGDKVWKVGVRPVFQVRFASGQSIRATAKHRLMTWGGWKRIADISAGNRVATARRFPEPESPEYWSDQRTVLLAHLIGDGSYVKHQPLRYTTASEENSVAVAEAAEKEFGATVNRHVGRGNWHQLVISGNGNRWHAKGVGAWLKELGIFGQRSCEKGVPQEVFRLDNDQIALFLRHLWATDGTISVRGEGSRGGHKVGLDTCSGDLASDVRALLLRLGIGVRIYVVPQSVGRPVHHVSVSGWENQTRFLRRVGAFGPRMAPAARLRKAIEGMTPNTNVDTLPLEVFARVRAGMRARGITQRQMAALRGTAYGGHSHFQFAPSRGVIANYAEILDDETLSLAATNDIFWDRVVAIEAAGEEQVYDLTVPGPASWLADGVVSHNSGALEQDADIVMFVYRDEVYNQETTKKGEAEIILAKHRNGPTGSIDLAFLGQYTKFADLARG